MRVFLVGVVRAFGPELSASSCLARAKSTLAPKRYVGVLADLVRSVELRVRHQGPGNDMESVLDDTAVDFCVGSFGHPDPRHVALIQPDES